jgi:hypothetical protein
MATAALKSGTQSGALFLGIPSGSELETTGFQYQAPIAHPFGAKLGSRNAYRAPLYTTDYMGSKQFADELNGMDQETIFVLQQRLQALGLLTKFTPGSMDSATRTAMKKLLETSNQTASKWQDTLSELEALDPSLLEASGLVKPGKDLDLPRVAPKTIELTNPDDIGKALINNAQELFSGGLSPEQVAEVVGKYQEMERAAQETNYTMTYGESGTGLDAKGGTLVRPPSLDTFADKELRTRNADQIFVSAMGQAAHRNISNLGRPGGGLIG